MALAELTPESCPLLVHADQLVRPYNTLVQQFRRIEQDMPAFLRDHDGVRKLMDDLEAVRRKLTRTRYLVGFCGPSQIGKSTTFNNVLEVPEAEARPGLWARIMGWFKRS